MIIPICLTFIMLLDSISRMHRIGPGWWFSLAIQLAIPVVLTWLCIEPWARARRMGWGLTFGDLFLRGLALTRLSRRIVPRDAAAALPGFSDRKSDFENLRDLTYEKSISFR